MKIEKHKDYEIIVFPNQDEGLKAQKALLAENSEFKHISTLAVVVAREKREDTLGLLTGAGVMIIGYYPFLYRDYEEGFFKRAQEYKPSGTADEFLKTITLCYVAPCVADSAKIRLIAYFSCDISEILPYLNAVIKNASYNKNTPTLTYTRGRRVINLYNIKVAIAKADDIIDAWKNLDEVRGLINKTYTNKATLKPNYEQKIRVTPFQVYGWLPKTNCGSCGEATCLAFAVKLLLGEQRLSACLPLFSQTQYSEKKKMMQEIAAALGIYGAERGS